MGEFAENYLEVGAWYTRITWRDEIESGVWKRGTKHFNYKSGDVRNSGGGWDEIKDPKFF